MTTQPTAIQRFLHHLAALDRASAKSASQLAFRRPPAAGSLIAILRAVFDELATEYVLPDEALTAGGARYWLTPAGHGLRLARRQTGAVRGDAHTNSLDLLLPTGVLVSTDITEDSYQPDPALTLTAADAGALDRLTPILERRLRRAGCEPLQA